jgi:hypothetical protein
MRVWFDLDPHLIQQATKRQLKRGNAFGFVSCAVGVPFLWCCYR